MVFYFDNYLDYCIYCMKLPWYYVIPSLNHSTATIHFFVRGFCSPFICVIPVCLLSCQGRFEVVSVACAKLVCVPTSIYLTSCGPTFTSQLMKLLFPVRNVKDERWQQSLVDSVTVFIQLDSVSPDVALEDSHCKRGCLCMK